MQETGPEPKTEVGNKDKKLLQLIHKCFIENNLTLEQGAQACISMLAYMVATAPTMQVGLLMVRRFAEQFDGSMRIAINHLAHSKKGPSNG